MKEIKVTIKGIAPILFNRMTEETERKIARKQTGGSLTVEEDRRIAREQRVYRNEQGLYCPAQAIKRCILNGSTKSGLKLGRKSLAQFLEALVFVKEGEVLFGKDAPDFIDERTGRRPPRTGGRMIIRRPGLKEGWKLSFTLLVVDDRIPLDHLKMAVQEGGILAGLLDGRPEFGRYELTQFQEVNGANS